MASTKKLIEGFTRFQETYFGDDNSLYASMKEGQPAKIMMIACCDSRVDPAILTSCEPGDLFIVRNVANLVPPFTEDTDHHGTSAALDFAVNHLEVETIIVMGHANCGGINALWEGEASSGSHLIQSWLSVAKKAKETVQETHQDSSLSEQLCACEQSSILVSLENLMSFPFIQQRIEAGNLRIHGWYFDVRTGQLLSYRPEADKFISVLEA